MFGLFYAAVTAIATTISGVKCAIEEQQQIDKAKKRKEEGKNKYNLYTDRKGATRDLATGELRSMDYICCEDRGEDQYLRDMYGNPVRNLSEERRQARYYAAKNDPRRTVSLWKKDYAHSKQLAGYQGRPYYCGEIYKDLSNGKLYVCRRFSIPSEVSSGYGSGKYYMDTETGFLVREADSMIYERQKGCCNVSEETSKKFIDYFNKKQQGEGYHLRSKVRNKYGWDDTETELGKASRMGNYYCNDFSTNDTPLITNF